MAALRRLIATFDLLHLPHLPHLGTGWKQFTSVVGDVLRRQLTSLDGGDDAVPRA